MTIMTALLPQPQPQRKRKQPSKRAPMFCLFLVTCIGLSPKECSSFSITSPRLTTRGLPVLAKRTDTLEAPQFSSLHLRPTPKNHRLYSSQQAFFQHRDYALEQSEPPLGAFASPLFRQPQRQFVSVVVPDSNASIYRGGKALKHQSSSSMTQSQMKLRVLQYMVQFIAQALYQAHELAERQTWLSQTWSFQRINQDVFEVGENLNFVWQAAGNALVQHGLSDYRLK